MHIDSARGGVQAECRQGRSGALRCCCVIRAGPGVASRKNARGAAKGVDFEPESSAMAATPGAGARGIQRPPPHRRGMPRLQHGVVEKARASPRRRHAQFPEAVEFEG